jgi:UDP-N-acetylglucosamine--N-acetylmuramyl-(pentapeptide) pyrophosphoryl-undecaprenol N-acetylglucosamine transferase
MKILFTGGGTGGHFYPIIAVAQAINKIADEEKLIDVKLYYMSDSPYDKRALFETGIKFKKAEAGKMRTYRSILNFFDLFKTAFGVIKAVVKIFTIYPDVIFAKGGYASFPALVAAKLFRIPVVLHSSDSVPGRVEVWAGKFASRVAISFPEAAQSFPKKEVALLGVPVRRELMLPVTSGAREYLKLEPDLPVLFAVGGSQGAAVINDVILDILPQLVEKYEVIHQIGKKNMKDVQGRADVVLIDSPFRNRYKPFDYLNETALRMIAGTADLAVSRAGATSIFELAAWGTPAILIPITESQGDHQRKNAFSYAHSGAAVVMEEKNLSPHVLLSEINRLMGDKAERERMRKSAKEFSRGDAAEKIAREIITLALEHER